MPPALPPWPAPDAPAAAPGPTSRPPAAPPSRAGPPPRRAPAPPPSTPRPCGWSTARRRAAAPPGGPAACRAAPASGPSASSRCAAAGRRACPDPRRCTAPAASRPTAPRTRSSRPPRPPRDPSPAARSPGGAGPSGRPPRRGTAPPAPPRSSVPPPPPRIRLPQAKAPGYRLRHPAGTITEHISRKPYELNGSSLLVPSRYRSCLSAWEGDGMTELPRSLPEFEARFPDEAACARWLLGKRWPDGFRCPACGHDKGWELARERLTLQCTACERQVSVPAGTVLHGSHLGLRTWFLAAWLMATHKNGIPARQLWLEPRAGSHKSARPLVRQPRRGV